MPSLRKLFVLAAAAAGLSFAAAPAGAQPSTPPTVAKLERLFPSCAGMLTQDDVNRLAKSNLDPIERFEAWRRKRFSMIEAPPVTACQSKVWRHLNGAGRSREDADSLSKSLNKNGVASANLPLAGGVDEYQGEVQVAINPNNYSQMVAGANTFFRDPTATCQAPAGAAKTFGTQALYGTKDGGKTWVHQCAPWPATLTGSVSGADTFFGSDPAMAWDNNGNAYAAYMLLSNKYSAGTFSSAIVVAKSTDSGTTWLPWGTVVNNLSTTALFDDKEMIAIDNSGGAYAGRVYVIWDENNVERVAYSDDGATWTNHVFSGTGISVGADIKVGPDGTVYAVWNRVFLPNNLGQATGDDTFFSKSINGGATWTAPVKIFSHSLASFQTYYHPAAQDERGVNSFPSLDVDRNPSSPFFNRLYLAYADNTVVFPNTFGQIDAYVRTSTDGGTSWSNRVKVNDDSTGITHIFPWLGVDPADGTVNVAWYDTRNDPDQERTQIYYARSSNGATSFEANLRLTDNGANFNNQINSSDENSFNNLNDNPNQYGDYMGIVAANRKISAVWTDSRQFFPNLTADPGKEDVATATYTNCTAPRLSVISASSSASGVTVSWGVQSWGTNATNGSYTVIRYGGSSCVGIGVLIGTYGSLTTSILDTPPPGTYRYGVTAKNNCPGTSLTPMKTSNCSAAVTY